MIFLALAAVLLGSPVQDPPQQPAQIDPDAPVALEDVEVTGRPLDAMIRNFVNEVAAPNRARGLARWEDQVCVGVANLRNEQAQYIADRLSTVAEDIGLTPGRPGCTPNIMIIASDDASGLARQLVEEKGRAFRAGGSGMDRGGSALRAFQASDAPVRWWQVSLPTDSETGNIAVRIPGECRNACVDVEDMAPHISVFAASRISTQIVDNLFRTFVIIDVDQVSAVSLVQLADYIAMVSLAQIDPEANTQQYSSILNVFDDPEYTQTLTDWDQAYLKGLYDAERNRQNRRAGRMEIADSIQRAHRDAQSDQAD
ncbi:MAG: hypothetical protein H7062_23215 [Candidatus Saccharimonas sp.]|nr:hypothetical protein [Planctomycetaceae bacterium]